MARRTQRARNEQGKVLLRILQDASDLTHTELQRAYTKSTGLRISYNTLRARIDDLVAAGKIVRSPEDWNPTYKAATPAAPPNPEARGPAVTTAQEGDIPISESGERIQQAVQRARGNKTPIGYNPDFLDQYTPGDTWYLPEALRARLTDLGRTAYMNQPAGTYARDIMQRLIIDLSYGSSRLEGNRYSRIDTEELIRGGQAASGASDRDRQMILNHKAAIEFLVENASEIGFNRYTVSGLHAFLAENLLENRDDEGRLRTRPIAIGASVYTPSAIPQVIEERFDTILRKAEAIPDPVEQSFFVMVHLPYLQPFIDVNKRTSRLAANIPLIKSNLCPLSFVDVPEKTYAEGMLGIYENTDVSLIRDVFTWAYERSCAQFKVLREAMGDPDPIRLNYRMELRGLVGDIVRAGEWPTDTQLYTRAEAYAIPEIDRSAFALSARRDLESLRPDILARYYLRISEFESWSKNVRDRRPRP